MLASAALLSATAHLRETDPARWGATYRATMAMWPTMTEAERERSGAWAVVWFLHRTATGQL